LAFKKSAPNSGFFRHIQNLNSWNPHHFRPFVMAKQKVGYVKDFMCQALAQWPDYFLVSEEKLEFRANVNGIEGCSQVLDEVVHQLVEQGVIANYLGESYPVTGNSREQGLAGLDRGAAAYFGIKAYGQHLNGYVVGDDGVKLWVARRAADRIHFPGKLDNIVAGGLPQNISLENNLLKECQEEANILADMVQRAKATGAISYCCETEVGLKPDTLYCYDLELPESFVPVNTDGEVSEFQLLNFESVLELVRDTDDFKPNCNLVILDFLIRHGAIRPEEPEYVELVSGLSS